MVYSPFPVAGFVTGLEKNREPWLLPEDAFSTFTNARVKRGVVEKRNGYSLWKTISTPSALPIMGIFRYYKAGVEYLIVFNTKRMFKWVDPNLVDQTGANTWSSGATDYFWVANWLDKLYIVNNKEQLKDYDGTTVANVSVDFGSGAVVMLSPMVFVYKQHLMVLNVTEDGTANPTRARWSKPNDPDDWTNDGYVDAPTSDGIVTARFIGDDLIVWFERSVWKLKYTQNVDLPFRWEKIDDSEGCLSTYSIVNFPNELLVAGTTKLLMTDGIDVVDINKRIPDAVLDINPNSHTTVYSILVKEEEQVLISYPSGVNTTNDKTLVLNYGNNSWAEYDYGFVCFGLFSELSTTTWDDITDTWDDITLSWDDYGEKRAGYPTVLAGDASGNIFKLNDGSNDNSAAINFEIATKKWNPFVGKGRKARLGWVDFLMDKNSVTSLTVDFYVNNESIPYQSLSLTPDGTEEKVWKRLDSGAIGNFHRININHTQSGQKVRIHAIVPWFEPASGIYEQ